VSANVPDKPRDRASSDQAAPQLKRSSPQSVDSGAVLRSVHHEGAAGEGAEALTAANEMVAKLEAEISQLTKRALDAEAKLEVCYLSNADMLIYLVIVMARCSLVIPYQEHCSKIAVTKYVLHFLSEHWLNDEYKSECHLCLLLPREWRQTCSRPISGKTN